MEATHVLSLDCQLVRYFMPHRYPMTLLDRALAYHMEEQRVVGVKNVAHNEPLVQGHFPDHPVFPGALLIEAMAQACGLLMNLEYARQRGAELWRLHEPGFLEEMPEIPMTVLVDSKVTQLNVARSGDQILLESRITVQHGEMCYFQVQARVGETPLAEGEIMLAYPPYTS